MVMAKENNYKIKNTTPKGEKLLFYVMCMWRSHLSSHILHKETSLSKNDCVYDRGLWGSLKVFRPLLFIAVIKHSKLALYHWRISKWEPGDRNWSKGHGETLLIDLFLRVCPACSLTQLRATHPGGSNTEYGLFPPHTTIINQENVPQAFI